MRNLTQRESFRYSSVEQLINEVDALPHWSAPGALPQYLKVLTKVAVLKQGFTYVNEEGYVVRGNYPEEVFEVVSEVCSSKFPTEDDVFENDVVKPGLLPDCNLLTLTNSSINMSILAERTHLDEIALSTFQININNEPATEAQVENMVESCYTYLRLRNNSKEDA